MTKKPNLSHFKVLSSVAYRHVPDQLRKKLDDKEEQMIIVAYYSTIGYKIYDAINKRIILSRGVIFYELKDWKLA